MGKKKIEKIEKLLTTKSYVIWYLQVSIENISLPFCFYFHLNYFDVFFSIFNIDDKLFSYEFYTYLLSTKIKKKRMQSVIIREPLKKVRVIKRFVILYFS